MAEELTRGRIVRTLSDLNTRVHHLEQKLAKTKQDRLHLLENGPSVKGFYETRTEYDKECANWADQASLAILVASADDLQACLEGEPMRDLVACERMYYDTKDQILEHSQKRELSYVAIAIINKRLELYRSLIKQLRQRLDEIDNPKGGDGNEAG